MLDQSVSALKQSIIKSKKIYENSKAFNTITHYEKILLAKRKGRRTKPNTGRVSLKTLEVSITNIFSRLLSMVAGEQGRRSSPARVRQPDDDDYEQLYGDAARDQ